MNYLDLFSGIGGFSLAMQRVSIDFDNHYASEIDKYARSIYAKRFPRSIQLGDVRKIGDELGTIDIITGGFPCQTFSIAGARRGFEDTRGTLFFDIARLADIYKPRYMVLENVKGLLNHDGGNTVRIILDKLRGLDYHVQLLLLNTKDFNVPQNRERVFFICSAPGERRPEVFRIRERKTEIVKDNALSVSTRNQTDEWHNSLSPCQTATQYKDLHKVVVGTLRTHKDGEGFREMQSGVCPTIPARGREDGSGQPIVAIPCLSPDRVEKRQNGRRFKEDGDPMFTLTAQDRHGVLVKSATKSGYEIAHEGDAINLSVPNSKTRRGRVGKGVAQTLDTACNQAVLRIGEIRTDEGLRVFKDNVCGTLRAMPFSGNKVLFNEFNIRRLTPIECERLQDFPDDWTKYGENDELISDSQRYKTIGNSVTVRVVEAIMQSIKDVL